jgi:hypothetical protein
MSKNPYAQVALTYVHRWFWCWAAGAFVLLLLTIYFMSASARPSENYLLIPTLILFIWLSSLATTHLVEQFANPRARLMPDFCRVHITVAAGLALAIGVFLPAMVTLFAGHRSVGLMALVMVSFAAVVWAQLATPALAGFLGLIWIVLLISPARDVAQQIISGQLELQAWGLLVLGVVALLLGGLHLLRLNEEMPSYARLLRRYRPERNQGTTDASDENQPLLPGLSAWFAERKVASATHHARRAGASRWSRICRWQVGMITAWQVLLWIPFFLLLFAWRVGRGLDNGTVQMLLVLPGAMAMDAMAQRPVTMATQLCLPVERSKYLKQLGAATALSYLKVWFAMSATVVLWCVFAKPRPDFAEIGRTLAASLLILVWFFGLGVWFGRFRSPKVIIPLSGLGLALTQCAMGFLLFVPMPQSRPFPLPTAVLAAIIGVLFALDAYRRWLITDLD